jgi:uncharacterized protein YidB (DUF937 family)
MGLLEEVIGAVSGTPTEGNQAAIAGSPLQGALMSLLGGQGQVGGIGGLVQRFEQAGLGNVAQSWIGNGANQPVNAEQVGRALGPETVQNIARETGLSPDSLLGRLAELLPGVIDKLTPNGQAADATPEGPGGGFKV